MRTCTCYIEINRAYPRGAAERKQDHYDVPKSVLKEPKNMTTGHNFWDASVWSLMIELTILLVGMLTANMLRRLIKPLRQSLIPSSVLGGFLILFANLAYEKIVGVPVFNKVTMETLTYHGLGLGFVAMALRSSKREKTRESNAAVFDAGVTTVSSYLLQGLLGLAITLGLFYVLGNWPASGLLLPMGYGQGPGQAYNWGHVYETATAYAPFQSGGSFGLTVAAMGFVSAGLGGVFYLQRIKKPTDSTTPALRWRIIRWKISVPRSTAKRRDWRVRQQMHGLPRIQVSRALSPGSSARPIAPAPSRRMSTIRVPVTSPTTNWLLLILSPPWR